MTMRLKNINKGTEADRRSVIIRISKAGNSRYIQQLIDCLNSNESYKNKRHIIRALGNIGDKKVGKYLFSLLNSEQGIILGDIAEALGKLNYVEARDKLKQLSESDIDWVAQKSRWALKKIKKAT